MTQTPKLMLAHTVHNRGVCCCNYMWFSLASYHCLLNMVCSVDSQERLWKFTVLISKMQYTGACRGAREISSLVFENILFFVYFIVYARIGHITKGKQLKSQDLYNFKMEMHHSPLRNLMQPACLFISRQLNVAWYVLDGNIKWLYFSPVVLISFWLFLLTFFLLPLFSFSSQWGERSTWPIPAKSSLCDSRSKYTCHVAKYCKRSSLFFQSKVQKELKLTQPTKKTNENRKMWRIHNSFWIDNTKTTQCM